MCKIPILVMTLLASINIYAQQFLPVEGIVNARDLGGYEVQGGFSVKTGKLIRAAHLADATDAVEEQYGSLENYLKGPIGLSDADLKILRCRYLIETNSSNQE